MRTDLYSVSGAYSSTFFKMMVITDENLKDILKLSPVTEATYLHEYVHFLQDITSVYGLMNIASIVDYLKLLNNKPLIESSLELVVPFIPEYSADNNVQANWLLKRIYLGDFEGQNDIKKIIRVYKKPAPTYTNKGTVNAEKVILEYNDSYNVLKEYSVGAYCVTESMAYAIEKLLYPNILPVPNKLPYSSVELICDHLLPDFATNPLNIIALCDACLMLFQPGKFLYDTILEMVKTGYKPSKPEDIYSFVFDNVIFNYNGHTTFQQLLISFGAEAISQLGDYFTTSLFKENRPWINYMISSAIDIRLQFPFFILELVRGGALKNNKAFAVLLNKIGSPFVINNNFEFTITISPGAHYDIAPEYLWVIQQIYKMCSYADKDGGLTENTYSCEMIKWCKDSARENGVDDWTDYDRCRFAPWERSKDPDPNFCTFGKMWKTWGLKDVTPINRK